MEKEYLKTNIGSFSPITNWHDLTKLIHILSNQMYVRYYVSISHDEQKHLELLSFTPVVDSAPLWGQMKQMRMKHLTSEKLENGMFKYMFMTEVFKN